MDSDNNSSTIIQRESAQVPVTVKVEHGRVTMKVLSEEQIEALSRSNSTNLTFFTLTVGIEVTLLVSILSDSIQDFYTPYFWIAFFCVLILMLYFLTRSILDFVETSKTKKSIKSESKSIEVASPLLPVTTDKE